MNCQARTKSPIDHCVGCTACLKVCKHNALSMGKDEQGFYVALKNEQCTSCGDCTSFCAHRNDVKSFLKRRKSLRRMQHGLKIMHCIKREILVGYLVRLH